MQVTLGSRGDYSVRAVLDVARHDPTLRKAREIAATMDIPHNYLTQILANLVRNELLAATAGPAGGYKLARPAGGISLFDVVRAAEGEITIEACVLRGGPCDWEGECPLHNVWSEAQQAFIERLSSVTFADLAAIDAAIQEGTSKPSPAPHPTPTPRRGQRG